MYILIAIIAFGVMIFVHELGHFLAAKASNVTVTEFSIGMGPLLWKKERGETQYSLRALPLGGYCAMEGEDGESDDPRAFSRQRPWKRLVILCAGAAMNFLLGLLFVIAVYAPSYGFASPVISDFYENCPYEGTLQVGDEIRRVNGERVYSSDNFAEYAARDTDGRLDLVVRRGARRLHLDDYLMVPVEYETERGREVKYGLYFEIAENTPLVTLKYSFYSCLDFVRMVKEGLVQLISGQTAVTEMTGVVGMVDIINETGQNAASVGEGLENILFLLALISVNLAVMNMLPVPGLDGGHILTLLLSLLYETIAGKKPDPRIENHIHTAGLFLLLALMVLIFFNDIVRIAVR